MLECHVDSKPVIIDARGQVAPLPLIELKRAIDSAGQGARVELLSDDPLMAGDIKRYAGLSGHEVLGETPEGGAVRYVIKRR